MAILRENIITKKKKSQGRKKIDIKRIENDKSRKVTFCKRRGGLFRKATELSILSGAEIAIVVHTSKHVFTFGHPTADSVIDRFLDAGDYRGRASSSTVNLHDYNRHYSEVCRAIEVEKKRNEEAKNIMDGGEGVGEEAMWWDEVVDGMDLDELEKYWAALEELVKNVTVRADELMLIQSSTTLTSDETGLFMNRNLMGELMPIQSSTTFTSDKTGLFMNRNLMGELMPIQSSTTLTSDETGLFMNRNLMGELMPIQSSTTLTSDETGSFMNQNLMGELMPIQSSTTFTSDETESFMNQNLMDELMSIQSSTSDETWSFMNQNQMGVDDGFFDGLNFLF